MTLAGATMAVFYDPVQVGLSVLAAVSASYATFDLAGRVTAARGSVRFAWFAGGAGVMGIGIWSMHFTAMLAFRLPIAAAYDWPTVLLSLLIGTLSSALALYIAILHKLSLTRALLSGLAVGLGIAALDYIGMASMRMAATTQFAPLLLILSILLAIAFWLVAPSLPFDLRVETRGTIGRKIGSWLVLAIAMCAMHYAGTASGRFTSACVSTDLAEGFSLSPLDSLGVGTVTLIILSLAILIGAKSRRRAAQAEDLQRRVIERTQELTDLNEKLAASEDRFRRVVETQSEAIFVLSQKQIVYINPAGMKLLGGQREEQFIGKDISEIVHPDSLGSVKERMRESRRTGVANASKEHTLLCLDGSTVEVESDSIPITWKGLSATEAIARDITERKRVEARLRDYERVVEGLEEMIVVVDREYRYLIANRAFLAYRGLNRDEVIGHSVAETLKPGLFETIVKAKLDECFQGSVVEHNTTYEYPVIDERDLSISCIPIESHGRIDRVACILHDITERKRAEQSLRKSQAELMRMTRAATMGELTTTIAHEINQPLTAVVADVSASLRWLAQQPPDLEETRSALAMAVREANRASDVVGRIRAQLKKTPPQMRKQNIVPVILDALEMLRSELQGGGIVLNTELAMNTPLVLGDPVQLRQLMLNLIMNAIDAMNDVGDRSRELLVRSSAHADGVLVQVQDTGEGLDPEAVHRIFEPFFTTKAEGIGMGLAISRSIVETHGGRLWATANSPYGAVFQFVLQQAEDRGY
jgi:PAS domain S-box-containing protein